MKNILLQSLLALFFFNLLPTQAQNVVSIREQYDKVQENIRQQEEIAEMRNHMELTFMHNVPGIGPQTFNYDLYFAPYETNGEGITLPHQLRYAFGKYNVAARDFYEEYLFDKSGQLIYIFSRCPLESLEEGNALKETRIYLQNHKPFRIKIDKILGDQTEPVHDTNISSEDSERVTALMRRAETLFQMFDTVQEKILPDF